MTSWVERDAPHAPPVLEPPSPPTDPGDNNEYYHSLDSILDFDWLIHLQITACKYRSAANNWCKYFIEHTHFRQLQ